MFYKYMRQIRDTVHMLLKTCEMMKPGQLCTVNKKVYRVAVADEDTYLGPCKYCEFVNSPIACFYRICKKFGIPSYCYLKLVKR